MERGLLAKQYFLEGYSCSMATILAFKEYIKMDINDFLKIGSAFGGGIARTRELCGVYTAAIMILGYLYGFDDNNFKKKSDLYKLIQEFTSLYKKNLSIYCFQILKKERKLESPIPNERSKEYYQNRPCAEIVRIGVTILENFINNKH